MEKITSFTINHIDLEPGVYVSRKDRYGSAVITTFDLRMTAPNREPVMNTLFSRTRPFISAPWAAAPASICFSQATIPPGRSLLW